MPQEMLAGLFGYSEFRRNLRMRYHLVTICG